MEEQTNTQPAVFPEHVTITRQRQDGRPGEPPAVELNTSFLTKDVKKPRGDWQEGHAGPQPPCGC